MARNITGRSEEEPWTENVWDAEEKKKDRGRKKYEEVTGLSS